WRLIRRDLRFPLRSQQTAEVRALLDDMHRAEYAADLDSFARAQAEAGDAGGWSDAFPFSRGTIRVTLEQLAEFFEEYIALLQRYQPVEEDAPEGSRVVLTRFFAWPAPLDEDADDASR